MNGVVLSLPKVPYTFGSIAGGLERTQVLIRALCTDDLRELVLLVRVHEVDIDADCELTVQLVPVAPTREDPGRDFPAPDVLAAAAIAGTEVGQLLRAVCLTPVPTHVQLRVVATQAASPGSISATLSIELLGRR
jgi:hypothetical protein